MFYRVIWITKKARTNAILELMKSKKHKETEFTILNKF